jgi:hypothetical protein
MVKEITAYLCEKCGYYSLNKEEIEKHEKKSITGINNSLDGLIFRDPLSNYKVIRRVQQVNANHKALYTRDAYTNKLKKYKFNSIRLCFPQPAFTSDDTIHFEMSGIKESQIVAYELPEAEFQRVSRKLKSKYPSIYKDISFKRTSKYLWHPKSQ